VRAYRVRCVLFNSYVFIFAFLPLVWLGYAAALRHGSYKIAKLWLLLASYVFYAYWNPVYVILLAASVVFNFSIGSWIGRCPRSSYSGRVLLVLGIAANLGLIIFYKYAGFLIQTTNAVAGLDYIVPQIILPLGISFYTFTQIAYLVDAYREDLSHYDFLTYNLFITYFPQLIAGPLLLHKELMPQLAVTPAADGPKQYLTFGLIWFGLGLCKKVLFADPQSQLVAAVFDHPANVGFADAWVGALAYTLQLYFDFSGYSDMAIGLSLMFGFRLPINFNSPYQATSIIDFWRRWHMTLSRFLRDYLYVPLGGNRRGTARRYVNLAVTMILGGIWHGAGWTFVIWGSLHALYLIVNHAWARSGWRLPVGAAWLLTMLCVVVGWVFFRAPSVETALDLTGTLFGAKGFDVEGAIVGLGDLVRVCALLALAVVAPNTQTLMQGRLGRWSIAGGVGTGLALLALRQNSEFLYFQF
jgi:alginate O-acetyltransferase complex protein AlgI